MDRQETEEIKALFESMILDGLTGGFNFDEESADEVNKAVGKLFKYIKLLEEENNTLSDHCARLEQPIIDEVLSKVKGK